MEGVGLICRGLALECTGEGILVELVLVNGDLVGLTGDCDLALIGCGCPVAKVVGVLLPCVVLDTVQVVSGDLLGFFFEDRLISVGSNLTAFSVESLTVISVGGNGTVISVGGNRTAISVGGNGTAFSVGGIWTVFSVGGIVTVFSVGGNGTVMSVGGFLTVFSVGGSGTVISVGGVSTVFSILIMFSVVGNWAAISVGGILTVDGCSCCGDSSDSSCSLSSLLVG